jgi:hypothetical protein
MSKSEVAHSIQLRLRRIVVEAVQRRRLDDANFRSFQEHHRAARLKRFIESVLGADTSDVGLLQRAAIHGGFAFVGVSGETRS